ncbi:MlaD family protein [Thioalkalivibrio sp. XN279]|uniref:MlaD family protein n=1 Tax=Thioalkalivibrio sp. XN279 TaxID=2714953 RepID=UPI00140E7DF3|nr:MlaD family protein [Thioalkalivibrio sp. XN279]NHA14335.1 MCE family protein [Thioalkalivibrio sp. XN279]
METRANYVVIGAFTLAAAIAAVAFGFFAANYAADSAWNRYQVLFEESVIGLSDGSPVLYNGVSIGRVTDIELDPADIRQVIVTIEVEAGVPIHKDSVATIRLTGLTGTAAIQLSGGTPGSPLLPPGIGEGHRIRAMASPFTRLLESSEGITVTANKVVKQLDALLSDANIQRIDRTLASLEQFSSSLASPDSELARLMENMAEASESLPGLLVELQATTVRFEEVLAGIDQGLLEDLPELKERLGATLSNLESLSGRVDSILASNQGELSRIGGAGMREIAGSMESLRGLVRDLSQLVRQIDNDPTRFLSGGERPEEYPTR